MPAKKPMDRLQAEAATGEVTVPLAGVNVRVQPAEEWRKWALSALRSGDYDRWAEGALHPDDVALFVNSDARVKDVNQFFEDWGAASGQSVGESSAS